MVWKVMIRASVIIMHRIIGRMNPKHYMTILDNGLNPT